ncbi:sigma-70 family RNA polymerase sigma factor [Streptomyces sp. NBC_01142]|uniref:RNA polymerase sigma factor n=1 Tax=Streptomyces sp. NBC_01142 TaxID=2975865 RepID=UPI00225B4670|nr:sigma-70 family RNA polymerase sigma factor [Streptomyces sp. NBC_01142]MCX4826286.1 sigma-70 family RNA polymerase sigma factor [Streptomyces sp. NBC_01142]
MDDRGMVSAMRSADPRGLAAAYDTYASRLYGYCRTILHNGDAASDALQDTFVLANERISQLRDPDRLRPWLYSIARNECLHQLRSMRRTTGLDDAGEVRDETVDLDAGLHTDELRSLVWDALEGLNPRDREVLELSLRQDLEGADLASVLGLSLNHTHALLSRARQQLENSVAALILARNERQDCTELAEILEDFDGTMTVLLRKRINRHIGRCEMCGDRKRREVRASALLSLLPVPVLPSELREPVLHAVFEPAGNEHRQEVTERATRFDDNGWPMPRDVWSRRMTPSPGKTVAAGAVGAGVLIAASWLWVAAGEGPGDQEHPTPGTTVVTPGGTVPPGVTLKPGDLVGDRTLGPHETLRPGETLGPPGGPKPPPSGPPKYAPDTPAPGVTPPPPRQPDTPPPAVPPPPVDTSPPDPDVPVVPPPPVDTSPSDPVVPDVPPDPDVPPVVPDVPPDPVDTSPSDPVVPDAPPDEQID